MEAHHGLVLPQRSQCQRWHRTHSLLTNILYSGRGSQLGGRPWSWGPARKGRYRVGLPAYPGSPQDRPLLAMQWDEQVFVDPMLPFGLRSAPKIFNVVADALAWHLHLSGIPLIRHYLDDFIIIAPPHSPQCEQSLAILDRECRALGVPIAEHKRDGPMSCLTYLGIEIDTLAGQLRLPQDKLLRL